MDYGGSKSSEDDGHGHGHRGGGGGGGGGPCGACKFLRRKCVKGCVFAPYFDSEGGTVQFAAVHKVFGASNASKLLLRIPPHKRLDAVLTLCYEALARARDPVYGCVAHIFALQHQVVNLQAELAYVQARLSTLQRLPHLPQPQASSSSSPSHALPYSNTHDFPIDPLLHQPHLASLELAAFLNPNSDQQQQQHDYGDLQALARELVSRYLPGPGVRVRPSNSH